MMKLEEVVAKANVRLNHKDMHPIVREKAKQLVKLAHAAGVAICITQAVRTIAEQNALYAQGRFGNKGPIVTNAKGGTSYHNYGLAVDFALYTPDGRSVKWDEFVDYDRDGVRDWMEVVKIAKKLGFEWGGDWVGFRDSPHFQMDFGYSIGSLLAGARPPSEVKKPVATKPASKPATKPASKPAAVAIVKFPGEALYAGAKDMDVKDVKRIENALGAKVDGKFDKALTAAVKAYQKRKKLKVDGVVGEVTWNLLF